MIGLANWEVTPEQKQLVNEVLDSGRLTYGDKTREFESRFADIHDVNYALFTSSGTSALKIALHASKDKYQWQDGDEVIIPAVTFVATMNAVLMNNLMPVLVDVDRDTVNIDSTKIEEAITSQTRAILPVHLFGQPADMNTIMPIARSNGLQVIEDSCETMFVNKVRGDVACFSTYLSHLLVTGVGGLIATNSEELATDMRSIMFHGRDESYLSIDDKPRDISKRFWFPRSGYSDRMTEMEAALGLGALGNWESMVKQRQENAKYLVRKLGDLAIDFPIIDISKHAFMFFPMIVEKRDELMLYLEKRGIETRTMMPLTNQPITESYLTGEYPEAEYINEHGLLIACHQYLKQENLYYMVTCIREFMSTADNYKKAWENI